MASKPKVTGETKRLNRVVGAGEALQKALDPAFRKRGFASRDIITHWAAMAPAPYDRIAAPDRLAWARGDRGAEGATLYLRCAPGHALALQHEGAVVARAVNRYFGYVLVREVRLSAEPMTIAATVPERAPVEPAEVPAVETAVRGVADDGLREALRRLGRGVIGRRGT